MGVAAPPPRFRKSSPRSWPKGFNPITRTLGVIRESVVFSPCDTSQGERRVTSFWGEKRRDKEWTFVYALWGGGGFSPLYDLEPFAPSVDLCCLCLICTPSAWASSFSIALLVDVITSRPRWMNLFHCLRTVELTIKGTVLMVSTLIACAIVEYHLL